MHRPIDCAARLSEACLKSGQLHCQTQLSHVSCERSCQTDSDAPYPMWVAPLESSPFPGSVSCPDDWYDNIRKSRVYRANFFADQAARMEVEAYVVNIEGAAHADEDGLINPLLHCYQDYVFNVNVWALPAVQVRCLLCILHGKLQNRCTVCL